MTIIETLSSQLGARRGAAAADRLCELCVELFDVDAAVISVVFDGENKGTLGASSDAAERWGELQFTLGEGPCLDSVAHGAPVLVPDLLAADQLRWQLYRSAMLDLGVGAVYAFPVTLAGQCVGAVDLYCVQAGRLTANQLIGALAAATLAELPLLDLLAGLHDTSFHTDISAWHELNELRRIEISQATGVLIGQLDLDAMWALIRLRAHAYATGHSPTDVAKDILDGSLRLEAW